MSRTVNARGDDLATALTRAVADLLGSDPDKVDLRLDAPGVDDLHGRFAIDLEVAAAGIPTETSPAAGPASAAQQAEPTGTKDAGRPGDHRDRDDDEGDDVELTAEDLDAEADAAADFLEGLLDAMDLPGDLRIKVHGDHAELEILEVGSGALIGRRGQTLEAVQELVRCSLQRQFQRRARVKVDVEGYRARRLEKLLEKAEEAVDQVLDGGEPERLEPMDVFERKAVHHLVSDVEGVTSRSQGREPARRVVIEPS